MEADLKYYAQAIITVVLLTDPLMRPLWGCSSRRSGSS
jgi:hypothetical protein